MIKQPWFVRIAPYENPEIAVVVLVENGAHGYYSADSKELWKHTLG